MSIDYPKSALRHRPIYQDVIAPQEGVPARARAAHPWRDDEEEESPFMAQEPISVRRRASSVVPRCTTAQQYPVRPAASRAPHTRGQVTTPQKRPARRVHWLLPVGGGMVVMLLVYLAVSWVHVWAVGLHDNWTYGTTRTFHLDAVVGHGDSRVHPTHIIAINLRGTVVIIEFPGGDLAHAKIYPGPHLPWSDAATSVITLAVKDVTGDGKPDLLVSIQQEPTLSSWQPSLTTLVMVNTGSAFKSAVQQEQ